MAGRLNQVEGNQRGRKRRANKGKIRKNGRVKRARGHYLNDSDADVREIKRKTKVKTSSQKGHPIQNNRTRRPFVPVSLDFALLKASFVVFAASLFTQCVVSLSISYSQILSLSLSLCAAFFFSIPKVSANMSDGGEKTCPLCAEEMDLTDQQLKPCKCGYEICIWCWHHIMDMAEKDDTEGRCPACRTPYDKEKIVGMAANCERLVAEINVERKKSQKAKIKPSDGRKQLSSVRVIQRNLVYVVGLPLNLAHEDLLHRREFFGQYGKVLKVSMSRTTAGIIQQFPNNTCSVYITYSREEEAIRCIQSLHGFVLDGRSLKACFGTTKYCHAWLRNVPCTNPDCLYLHEIGSQEDSFTKDEIISAYTRSRAQQITASTSKMLRSGNTLPPPVDDYGNNTSLSASRPIIKSTSNSTIISSKGSPPIGSSSRSMALPPAASWGMRASNQLLVGNSTCANGSSKTKTDAVCDALAFSTAVSNTSQTSMLHGDVGIKVTWDEECEINDGKSKPDSLKSAKLNVGADCRADISEKPAKNIIATTELNLSNPLSKNDWSTTVSLNITNSALHTAQSCVPEKVWTAATDGKIDKLCSDMPSLSIDTNVRSETSGLVRTSSSPCDFSMIKSPVSQGIQQPYSDQYREQFSSPATECTARPVNGACVLNEQFDQQTDPQTQSFDEFVSEVEDIISFDNQRLKDPEVVSLTNCLPNSSNSLPFSLHSRSSSLQDSETFGTVDLKADPPYLDNRGGDHSLLNASSNSVIPNGYPETISSSASSERPIERSFLLPSGKEGRDIRRLQSDVGSISALDAGENSIISNILSLDPNAWDESLASPQNLAKFLGQNDQKPSSLRMSCSWKAQTNSQSRFSFAREEEARNQALDVDSSVSTFGQLPRDHSFRQDLIDGRNSCMDKTGMGNGFVTRNFEEPEIFTSSKSSISRIQVSTPPGFSMPNRAPPPGFSSRERMDQNFDTISGSHLLESSPFLRNPYQTPPPGNIGSNADIEFMDPAILAVGKGKHQGGLNTPVLDTRSNFPPQFGDFENEARLQLLMQRSLPSHQNIRYTDIGDSFSSPSDPYGIPSRLVDQSQVSNLSPFAHLSLQQSRNGLTSNGHWYSWNEIHGGNNLAVAELLRNERLGYNKFYTAGYENSKYQMPSSGDLYNRAFEM